MIRTFILRGNFAPRTTKEERRLIKKMRGLNARVVTEARLVRVWYLGNNLYEIAELLTTIGNFPDHELSLHEY